MVFLGHGRGNFLPALSAYRLLCARAIPRIFFWGGGGSCLYVPGGSIRSLFFFLSRAAFKDRPQGPPTANSQPLPTATNRQLPTAGNSHQPPTANC